MIESQLKTGNEDQIDENEDFTKKIIIYFNNCIGVSNSLTDNTNLKSVP